LRIPSLPPEKQTVLDRVTERLSSVPDVAAVVLGGSTARGAATPASDLDIGIYYSEKQPFSIPAIREVAEAVAAPGSAPLVTDFYGWGAWVNGGAWIHTPAGKIDFIYRCLEQVDQTIQDAFEGKVTLDYNQQPPYGFPSIIYLGETSTCIPLLDPQGRIAQLKERLRAYPPRLKQKLVADTLWMTEFTLLHGRGFAAKADVYNTAGCLTRAAAYLTQVLFALNERFFISDKTALREIKGFALSPAGYAERLTQVLAHPGENAVELSSAVQEMRLLWQNVVELSGEYTPQFQM
jgi:hypothetical protein